MSTYTRRVQLTGGSTYIISLPSKWVKTNSIAKGSEVTIDDSQGILTVSQSSNSRKENSRILNFSGKPDPEFFQRVLTSIYISGFDTLTIKSSTYIGSNIAEAVRKFSRLVMGVEIFDESARSIVLQNVLDSKSFPLSNAVRRMSLNVKTMIEDTLHGITEPDSVLLDSVIGRDDDVDRYQLYVYREVKNGENEDENSIYYLIISRILERIADHSVNISKIWKNTPDLGKESASSLVEFLGQVGLLFSEAIEAFYARRFEELNTIIGKKAEIMARKAEIVKSVSGERSAQALLPASEEVARIGLYATDVAELAMDLMLSGSQELSI